MIAFVEAAQSRVGWCAAARARKASSEGPGSRTRVRRSTIDVGLVAVTSIVEAEAASVYTYASGVGEPDVVPGGATAPENAPISPNYEIKTIARSICNLGLRNKEV
jgi:hypothetical protein